MNRQFYFGYAAILMCILCTAARSATGQVFFDGVDQGAYIGLQTETDAQVIVSEGGRLDLLPGGSIALIERISGGGTVSVMGGSVQSPSDTVFSFGQQIRVLWFGNFEMSSGWIKGNDAADRSNGETANAGLQIGHGTGRVHITGGLIEGGSGPFGARGDTPDFLLHAPAILSDDLAEEAIIDGGIFIGGSNVGVNPDPVHEYASAGLFMSGSFTINGGVFRGGDILDDGGDGVVGGSAGLDVRSGVADVNGGEFYEGDYGGAQSDWISEITVTAGELNLRGGELESLTDLGLGETNIYATAFAVDGEPLDFDGQPSATLNRSAVLTIDFLGQEPESFPVRLFNHSELNFFLISGVGGDYDADGLVSQADLDLVLLNWGDEVTPEAWVEATAFDGLISQNELDAVLLNWGDGTPPNLSAIPEPATALITILGGIWASRRQLNSR